MKYKMPNMYLYLGERQWIRDFLQVGVDADFKAATTQYTCVCFQTFKEIYKRNI